MYKIHGPSKQAVEIVYVNPATKELQGRLPDGGKVTIEVTGDKVFRWPVVGERWRICRDTQFQTAWNLDTRIQDRIIREENGQTKISFQEEFGIQDLNPGDTRVDGKDIYTSEGKRLYTLEEFNDHWTWGQPQEIHAASGDNFNAGMTGVGTNWTWVDPLATALGESVVSPFYFEITPPWDAWIEVSYAVPVINISSPAVWSRLDCYIYLTSFPALWDDGEEHDGESIVSKDQWGRSAVTSHPSIGYYHTLQGSAWIPLYGGVKYNLQPMFQSVGTGPWQIWRHPDMMWIQHGGLKKKTESPI